MLANLKFNIKQTPLINRVWLFRQPLQVHCIIKVTLYLGRRWVYTKQKNVTLISYRAISHTGFVCPTTWGNNPNSVRNRKEGGSLPSCTPTVPPAQRWLFRETCVSRARDKAGILNVFIQFNPLPHETIELDNRPILGDFHFYELFVQALKFWLLFVWVFPSATTTVCVPSNENVTQSWRQWNLHAQMTRNREKQTKHTLDPARLFLNCSWNN